MELIRLNYGPFNRDQMVAWMPQLRTIAVRKKRMSYWQVQDHCCCDGYVGSRVVMVTFESLLRNETQQYIGLKAIVIVSD